MLVLVHGTFVDTVSTFGKLWTLHPQRGARAVRALRRPRLRARPPDARREPDRQRADAGARAARGRAAAPADAFARRPRRRGAGARLRRRAAARGPGAVRRCARVAGEAARDYAQHRETCRRWSTRRRPRACRSSASCASPARRAARCWPASRLDAYLSVLKWGLRTGRRAGGAGAGRLPQRGGAAPRRPGRAAGPGGDDARQPAGAAGSTRGGEPIAGRAARGGRRHRRRLGRLLGEDAARRRLLLDRQRPRRADALDVRRRGARAAGATLPARPRRQGLALQLLRQRAQRRGRGQRR